MIKDNQKVFNRLLVIMDAQITAISFVLAYYIKFYILNDGPGIGVLPVQEYYKLLPFIVPGYMFLYYRCSVYSPKRTVRRRHEIYSILQANTIGLAALIIILYMIIREINFSRSGSSFPHGCDRRQENQDRSGKKIISGSNDIRDRRRMFYIF